jgi:hypothetical protein
MSENRMLSTGVINAWGDVDRSMIQGTLSVHTGAYLCSWRSMFFSGVGFHPRLLAVRVA